MRKKIAIKGHPTRGKEVIELLEMMGGKNPAYLGVDINVIYAIDDKGIIRSLFFNDSILMKMEYNVFTLEKFLEKYPFKVGDVVYDIVDGDPGIITAMKWDEDVSDMKYHVAFDNGDMGWYTNDTIGFLNENENLEERKNMNKKLAIKGHPTRGKAVIALLEMMGGINDEGHSGTNTWKDEYYFLDNGCIRAYDWCDGIKFTLEEFLEKYPFKVGDKAVYEDDNDIVAISEIKWDDTVGDIFYNVKRIDEDDYFLCPPELLKPYKETNKNKFGTAKKPLESKSNAVKLVDGKVVDDLDERKTMNKKLAIKGHPTRGKEVIEILKMMGGRGMNTLKGNTDWYMIDECENNLIKIYGYNYIHCHNFITFTLEEFLKKYPFKVGDKVMDGLGNSLTIKSMSWSEDCETMVYDFKETEDVLCAEDIEVMNDIHTKSSKMKNVLAELLEHIKTTPKEELEREFEEIKEWSNVGPTVEEFRTFCECVNKKPKYPTTYDECVEIMDVELWNTLWGGDATEYEKQTEGLINALIRLRVCRDAYWKIAGEEMGLGKPWKPDWCDEDKLKYCIECSYGTIDKTVKFVWSRILSFPTEEMRDVFYENFKDLIEKCKELL